MYFRAKVVTYMAILLTAIAACALVVEPLWLKSACMGALVLLTGLAFLASPSRTGHAAEFAVVLVIGSALLIGAAWYASPLVAR